MEITYFNREKRAGSFSIEELFGSIKQKLKDKYGLRIRDFLYEPSLGRLRNALQAKQYQGDINHITGDVNFLAFGLTPAKTILTVHDLGMYEKLSGIKKLIYRYFWFEGPLKRVAWITTVSEATKQKVLHFFNVDPDKIKVVYNPLSPLFQYAQKAFNEEKPVILHIGSAPHKNLDNLIEAVPEIPCHLNIIGKPSGEQIQKLNDYGIEYSLDFDIPYEEVYERYKACDLVYFASTYEGFGRPVMEANAVGRPVLTSNVTSMPEIAGEAAVIVDPYNVDQIREGIMNIIYSAELRERLIEEGKQNVKRFTAERIADEYYNLYKMVHEKTRQSSL